MRHLWSAGEQLVDDRRLTRRSFNDIGKEYSMTYHDFRARAAAARSVA